MPAESEKSEYLLAGVFRFRGYNAWPVISRACYRTFYKQAMQMGSLGVDLIYGTQGASLRTWLAGLFAVQSLRATVKHFFLLHGARFQHAENCGIIQIFYCLLLEDIGNDLRTLLLRADGFAAFYRFVLTAEGVCLTRLEIWRNFRVKECGLTGLRIVVV